MISTAVQVGHRLARISSPNNRRHREKPTPVAVDFCCGMGGLSLAAKDLGVKIIAGVDLNAGALKTFARNFPEAEAIEGSVRSQKIIKKCQQLLKLNSDTSTPFIVLSGPPCQGFSIAGSRDPADPRNRILTAVARAIAKLQPDCALIENVSMVLAPRNKSRLITLRRILADAGYSVAHVLLDASEFGVPQKRKRAFFLVTRTQLDEQDILKLLDRYKVPQRSAEEALRGLPTPPIRPNDYDDEVDNAATANHFAMQHSPRVMNKIAAIEPGTGPMSYRRLHPTRPSNTLFSGHRAPPAHFTESRSITVREGARLQGFPDSFRIYGSFGNQMEQVTNAVPPPLARAVLNVLAVFTKLPICTYA